LLRRPVGTSSPESGITLAAAVGPRRSGQCLTETELLRLLRQSIGRFDPVPIVLRPYSASIAVDTDGPPASPTRRQGMAMTLTEVEKAARDAEQKLDDLRA
jgi:hypothetical protein